MLYPSKLWCLLIFVYIDFKCMIFVICGDFRPGSNSNRTEISRDHLGKFYTMLESNGLDYFSQLGFKKHFHIHVYGFMKKY